MLDRAAAQDPTRSAREAGRAPTTRGGVRRDRRSVRTAYDTFLGTGCLSPGVDPLVAASWRRSLSSGVDPDSPRAAAGLADRELDEYRATHPLAPLMPVVRDLVVDAARDDGLVVAVCDDAGRLLWVEGDARTRTTAERVGFVAGAVWREESVGTNAPGTALATRRAVQVLGAEHFSRPVQSLNCAAAPIRGADGRLLGVLDVTGGRAAASHVALSLVRATVASLERELAALGPGRPGGRAGTGDSTARAALQLLGTPVLHRPGGVHRLSPRHAEILVLLGEHPRGLTAEELAVLLHPGDLSDVAVRAEISRLRRVAGTLVVGSRPYRLAPGVRSDVDVVREHLAAGDPTAALAACAGPLLPRSLAPGVERVRAELAAELRSAVLSSTGTAALDAWTRTDDGADDVEAWSLLVQRAEHGSPLWSRARAHLAVVDAALR
ncbi:GAF domain-containing protein [Isoptericola sp. CG 20/1183]|uniref:GAF domain-containing protein n=1 Tax=Isoptericola halotolerans TaxID=300560 RepID=A0ABX5EHB5_9MICO|nr:MULTISPECIES: helix-turn-helix domain-containing protein [Isoptericola]PRZ07811.1 GAF domain-containing protein [Isoptericola halotolerans]PRZ07830.1 GAF domain-containing protein [Isoptericola sp. CG 20/1183]